MDDQFMECSHKLYLKNWASFALYFPFATAQFHTMDLLLLLLLLVLNYSSTEADPLSIDCKPNGEYARNSAYGSNLSILLDSLSSMNSTFSTDAKGYIPDRTYGLVLCRADITLSDCISCIQNAAQDILSQCPYYKQAIIWYDYCQLRYSNMRFFSLIDNSYVREFRDPNNETDPETFSNLVRGLIVKLSNVAAYESELMFATGRLLYRSDLPAIHGMVQCTRDLTRDGCSSCLEQIRFHLQYYFAGKRGGRVSGMSCYLRYEVYSFFQGEPTIEINILPSAAEGNIFLHKIKLPVNHNFIPLHHNQ